jgi:hypothetical protein
VKNSSDLLNLNNRIKSEADEFLYGKGLIGILNSFGLPHISGSYALNLMTCRDLDIYLEIETICSREFYSLWGQIAELLNPVKMHFRDERIAKTSGLPAGLNWGSYLENERADGWKIDIWAIDA